MRRPLIVLCALAALIALPIAGGADGRFVIAVFVALAVVASIAAARAVYAPPERALPALRPTPDTNQLTEIREIARVVGAAEISEFEVDRSLRPLLTPIATLRLARRGVSFDRNPPEVETLLGSELAELLRPGRPRYSNRVAGGLRQEQIEAIIERLEEL